MQNLWHGKVIFTRETGKRKKRNEERKTKQVNLREKKVFAGRDLSQG